jgi:hypothetical protein
MCKQKRKTIKATDDVAVAGGEPDAPWRMFTQLMVVDDGRVRLPNAIGLGRVVHPTTGNVASVAIPHILLELRASIM